MTNELVMRGNGLQKEENREEKGSLLSTVARGRKRKDGRTQHEWEAERQRKVF